MVEINPPRRAGQEVTELFSRYETALVGNDVETLTSFSWKSPLAVRYGVAENLYGFDAIAQFRAPRARPSTSRVR